MGVILVVLFLALTGTQFGYVYGLPVRPTPQTYPHDGNIPPVLEGWQAYGGIYAAVPVLALVFFSLLFGCTWCIRNKNRKLFTANAVHLHEPRRSQAPEAEFAEPVNNNISEDNNNGPISLREMQNIANNNAAAYIVSENEERNRVSRESVVEFEPLPDVGLRVADPLEHCADWFGGVDIPRNQLQYLREIGRGWFGRVVEGEIEDAGTTTPVAVKIIKQNASLEDKARFLDEAKMYRDIRHENILAFITKCLQEDPWILLFELCPIDLHQYLVVNQPKMAKLNDKGVPLRLMSDVSAAVAHLHSRGYLYGSVWSGSVRVRGDPEQPRAVLGRYFNAQPHYEFAAPETMARPSVYTSSSEVWSLGTLIWEVCTWGAVPTNPPHPPDLPCPYRNHVCQVIQLCWNPNEESRPTSSQIHALVNHLYVTHTEASEPSRDDGYGSSDFEERWQRLKPNTIPKIDEHVAIVHAPSTSTTSHFTTDHDYDLPSIQDGLSVDLNTAVSRSSSIMSDKDPLSVQIKSESLTNLHGSLEDVRNIYLTHNEMAVLECHQGNIALEESKDKEDRSDSSVDPWLKDIIAGSQDDVSYYRDVSDVIKNLDNILNSEKTSSSESSHQASPSRDNLSLDCKKDYPMQSCMVKSPGISNFQNILESGYSADSEEHLPCEDDDGDRDTIGTLSHSFERHSDTISQQTLENLTPETPIKDVDMVSNIETQVEVRTDVLLSDQLGNVEEINRPRDVKFRNMYSEIPKLKELCLESISSVSENIEQGSATKDCLTPCLLKESTDSKEIKFIDNKLKCVTSKDTTHIVREHPEIINFEVEATLLSSVSHNIPCSTNSSIEFVEKTELPPTAVELESRIEGNEGCLIVDNINESINTVDLRIENKQEYPMPEKPEPNDIANEKIKRDIDVVNTVGKDNGYKSHFDPHTEDLKTLIKKSDQDDYLQQSVDTINPYTEKSYNNDIENVEQSTETQCKDRVVDLEISSSKCLEIGGNVPFVHEEMVLQLDEVDVNSKIIYSSNNESIKDISKLVTESNYNPVIEVSPLLLKNSNSLENTEKENPSPENYKPDTVQNTYTENLLQIKTDSSPETVKKIMPVLPDIVQTIHRHVIEEAYVDNKNVTNTSENRSDNIVNELQEQSNDSTVYIDLINHTNKQECDENITSPINATTVDRQIISDSHNSVDNESTHYLDLPSLIKETDSFLYNERMISNDVVFASTPLGSDNSGYQNNDSIERPDMQDSQILSKTKVPENSSGFTLTKLEQVYGLDNVSPLDSPTKSHHTDTFDENSSVVLGPFESLEPYKVPKFTGEAVDLPREELLAFSSNFSEINLETPSPLRDGNFLNEVPDIVHDDLQFDDLSALTNDNKSEPGPDAEGKEVKTDQSDPQTENNTEESGHSVTEKRISPSTPPNSPGNFLASTSQQKYLVDIDLTSPSKIPGTDSVSSLQNDIDLNQIELQFTSKLAIAENENNLNLEYSGPLTVEGLESSSAVPEAFLAGNGGSLEDIEALRNELELKLPLAQVAAIEPQCGNEWSSDLPPPPEMVVTYLCALSPIAEETGQQLCAYENDVNWNPATRTDSSESYPEPCNNSTDEVTELPTATQPQSPLGQSTYTIMSREQTPNQTFTILKDIGSSKEITMSADSMNASPIKILNNDPESPIDDKIYTKDDGVKESSYERISQVSPFLLSPSTETSAPDNSYNLDNATGVSTLSKTTVPTDAKQSQPTECLSKATSIDSWCSNDTLYNVEENFDDLALEPDAEFIPDKEEVKSDSTDTLTHNEDEKELSHCSTYIIHDSKSEVCDSFSPDSITANDNASTKVKTELTGATPSPQKSEQNESTKSQTKDLAYGTLMSGIPSYSNCTTEVISAMDDIWKLPQPEMIRASPLEGNIHFTTPNLTEDAEADISSPQINTQPSIKRLQSVDILCIQDNVEDRQDKSESTDPGLLSEVHDSPHYNYKNSMAPSITSTPLTTLCQDSENVEGISIQFPEIAQESTEITSSLPGFNTFQQSAENRPCDIRGEYSTTSSHISEDEILLGGDSKTLSALNFALPATDRTPTYSDFEYSISTQPQELTSFNKSSQIIDSESNSENFRQFENSARNRPQDLTAIIESTSALLQSERISQEFSHIPSNTDQGGTSLYNNAANSQDPTQFSRISPPFFSNVIESHNLVNFIEPNNGYLVNFDMEDENEQPHSIIITESALEAFKDEPTITYDSHAGQVNEFLNQTFDSHTAKVPPQDNENLLDFISSGDVAEPNNHDSKTTPGFSVSDGVTQPNHELLQSLTLNCSTSNGSVEEIKIKKLATEIIPSNSQNYATVNFLNENFEELIESNVDDNDLKEIKMSDKEISKDAIKIGNDEESKNSSHEQNKLIDKRDINASHVKTNGVESNVEIASVTENFLQNEKNYCHLESYLPILSDIRFTGPGTEIMSTSFTQESPTEPTSPECEQDGKPDTVTDIMKEWDSDTDSHSTNSSSGEFIWKQRESGPQREGGNSVNEAVSDGGAQSSASGDSGSGSDSDGLEFVPSSWDCRAEPAKSSLRSLEATPDNKKRVVFKRQKYHCVYEYPREVADGETHSPAAYLPDLSTYTEWDPTSAEEAELGYGQLFGAPSPLDLYSMRSGIAFGPDYDEDFFISSSARPFESLGIMSTTSQFFPGMHLKPSILDREIPDDDDFPPPPPPLPTTIVQARTPSLDFTTPDSGVEDITPGSTTDEDFKKKLPESELPWKAVDSASSSESVSPSSPGGEALGGLRHTRDKLKLDLPPSPHIPSPRHNRVFNFVLDKPKRRAQDSEGTTPLVMTDETPIVTTSLPLQKDEDLTVPEPTFSTFGKCVQKVEPEQKIVLTDDESETKEDNKVVEAVKGEGTVLDSGDEDSGIESSSKATLERNKTNVS